MFLYPFKSIQESGYAYNYLNEAEMLEAMKNKYQSLNGKQAENIYDPIKHSLAPGIYMGIPQNDRPKYMSVIGGKGQMTFPNIKVGRDYNDGYLKPNTDGSSSSQDSGISMEKNRNKQNAAPSTYGYLDPVPNDGNRSQRTQAEQLYGYLNSGGSTYGSISSGYLEPAQSEAPPEYTQPYQFSPAGFNTARQPSYMTPISSKHQQHQSTVADPGYLKRMGYQGQISSSQANFWPYYPKPTIKMNNFGKRGGLNIPTPAPWIRQ